MKVLVLGATGETGRLIVRFALAKAIPEAFPPMQRVDFSRV
jgi:uncharacterized protein YbjT (DUF2867 family)